MPTDDLPTRFDLRQGFATIVCLREVATQDGSLASWAYVSDGLLAHGQKAACADAASSTGSTG